MPQSTITFQIKSTLSRFGVILNIAAVKGDDCHEMRDNACPHNSDIITYLGASAKHLKLSARNSAFWCLEYRNRALLASKFCNVIIITALLDMQKSC